MALIWHLSAHTPPPSGECLSEVILACSASGQSPAWNVLRDMSSVDLRKSLILRKNSWISLVSKGRAHWWGWAISYSRQLPGCSPADVLSSHKKGRRSRWWALVKSIIHAIPGNRPQSHEESWLTIAGATSSGIPIYLKVTQQESQANELMFCRRCETTISCFKNNRNLTCYVYMLPICPVLIHILLSWQCLL